MPLADLEQARGMRLAWADKLIPLKGLHFGNSRHHTNSAGSDSLKHIDLSIFVSNRSREQKRKSRLSCFRRRRFAPGRTQIVFKEILLSRGDGAVEKTRT